MAVSAAPKRKEQETKAIANEKRIKEIINGGGKTVSEKIAPPEPVEEVLKGISIKLTATEIETIKELRNMRVAPRRKKIAISLSDWIIEGVQEKIEREKRKYEF